MRTLNKAGLLALWLAAPSSMQAFSIEDYFLNFADITSYPEDHWTWAYTTINYTFDASFSAAFPDPAVKDEVREAFREWSQVHSPFRGPTYSYYRYGGDRKFGDIRSIILHEIGHVLGLHHANQGDAVGLNYEPGPAGTWVSRTATRTEVMNSGIRPGAYNRILGLDEIQGYEFIYATTPLNFVEVPPSSFAHIVVTTFKDAPDVYARGGPRGSLREPFSPLGLLKGADTRFGVIRFNLACGVPMGLQTLGINWRYRSLTGRDTRAIVLRTRGTDHPTPISYFRNTIGSPDYVFDGFSTTQMTPILEDQLHRWSNPHGVASIPASESISIGLELDVWDWALVESGIQDSLGTISALAPFLTSKPWYHTNVTAVAGGAGGAGGLTVERPFIAATGLRLETPVPALVSGLAVADVTGLGLKLADLTPDLLNNLAAQQRVEPIQAFGQRALAAEQPFVLVFQGEVNDLPDDLRQSGNYLLLNRPDLEDKELLVFVTGRTAEAEVEMSALITRAPIGNAGAPCVAVTESEPNNTWSTATYLGSSRFAIGAGSIDQPGDVDYFAFEAPARARLWVTVDTGGPASAAATTRDSLLTVYGTKGTDVLEIDDDDGSGNGGDGATESDLASAIAGLRTRNSGTHYLSVRAYDAAARLSPYQVFLTITTETNDLGSEIESNDTPPLADYIVSPDRSIGVRSAAINRPGDVDYFSVHVPAGPRVLHVSVDADPERDGVGTDVVAELLAADGTVLYTANSSTRGAAGNPPAEGFDFVLPSDPANSPPAPVRTYYVRVTGADPNSVGTYDVMVASCPLDPPELSISREQGQLVLMAPLHAVGFRLVSAESLAGPWQDAGLSANVVANHYCWALAPAAGAKFFRLQSR
jgi:hypothetical protein